MNPSSPRSVADQRAALPPRLLVSLYFGWAHACLLAAFLLMAGNPGWFTQFFYDPRTIAVVHLVTLGWISTSILGALYIVAPTALKTPLAAGPGDYGALAFLVLGTSGMVAHFLLSRYEGMYLSALMVWLALAHVGARVMRAQRRVAIPGAVKLHINLAFANILVAAAIGIALGIDKSRSFLPGNVLSNVYAHAHLAAIGWAGMMIMGVGYRLFPMVLPAAMPAGNRLYASALLLEAGLLGLIPFQLLQHRWLGAFVLLIAAGFGAFLLEIHRMRSNRKPPAAHLPRPDYGTLHSLQALAYLVVSIAMGGVLAFAPESELTFRLVPVYGFIGLVGFLAQTVVGMESRLLPMFSSLHVLVTSGGLSLLQQETLNRRLHAVVFPLWTLGLPTVAWGLLAGAPGLIRIGACLLVLAQLLTSLAALRWLRRAYAGPASFPSPPPLPGGTGITISSGP